MTKVKTKRCKFCKTLIDIELINKSWVCKSCNAKINQIQQETGKPRNKAEGIYGTLKSKERKQKTGFKKRNNKPIYQKEYLQYKEYLQTKHWELTKERFYNSKQFTGGCFVCGCQENLQVHHKTYENIQRERLTDLVCLCKDCHRMIHGIVKFTKNPRIKLINAHVRLRNLVKNGMNTWDAYKKLLQEKIK